MPAYSRRPVTPVVDVLVGGFCGSAAGYEELRAEMYRATGNTTVFVSMTRFGLPFATDSSRRPRYPRALWRQAVHLSRKLKPYDNGEREFRMFGHSMGGAISLIAADNQAVPIRRVVALNTACLYVDGVVPLAKRMIAKGKSDAFLSAHSPDPQVRRLIRARVPGVVAYMANPWRCLQEGLALARTPLFAQTMPRLQGRNIEVMVGYSDDDVVFLDGKMQNALEAFPGIKSFLLQNTLHDVQYTPRTTVETMCVYGAL